MYRAGQYRVPPFDKTKREHYWIVMLTFKIDVENLEGSAHTFDLKPTDIVSTSVVGCYYCQTPYTKEVNKLACEYKE